MVDRWFVYIDSYLLCLPCRHGMTMIDRDQTDNM